MEMRNEQPMWISTYHKQLRYFPKEKKYPTISLLSQAKTSELPPTAEYYTL